MDQDNFVKIPREDGQRMMLLLQEAHYQAALNVECLSTHVFENAYLGSQSIIQSVASALLSTGEVHAPITLTRESIQFMKANKQGFTGYMASVVKNGGKILGLGNSFHKDKIDPNFRVCVDFYRQLHMDLGIGESDMDHYAGIGNKLLSEYKEKEVELFPNAALITAAITEFIGGLPFIENWFFIAGRSRAWLEMTGKAELAKYENK